MTLSSEYEVETFTGQFVNVKSPDPDTINLEDIAHALSQTCRYGGHCQEYMSVAEHAVFVSVRLERQGYGRRTQLAGLHHDDAEAYLGDIPRPMKPLLGPRYAHMTDRMDHAIVTGLKLPLTAEDFHDTNVKDADNFSLFVEARHLLPSKGKGWWNNEQGSYRWDLEGLPSRIVVPDYWKGGLLPKDACAMFLGRHQELLRKD